MADISEIITRKAEAELLRVTDSISAFPVRYSAIYFPFSQLQKEYRNELQLRLALNQIHEIIQYNLHYIFLLKNSDVYVLFKGGRVASESRSFIEKIVAQLRAQFVDDPLSYKTVQGVDTAFYMSFILESDWNPFIAHVREKIISISQNSDTAPEPAPSQGPALAGAPIFPANPVEPEIDRNSFFTPAALAELEEKLRTANITGLLRNQYICAMPPGSAKPMPILNEIFVSIAGVAQLLKQPVNLASNYHLFLYVTEILDRLLLAHLARREYQPFLGKAASLNLNVSSLMKDEFKEFDKSIPAAAKKTILIELQTADLFANINKTLEAKSMLQQLGYRVCLDGMDKISFAQLQEDALGFDLIKLIWNADLPSNLPSEENKRLLAQVKRFGPSRVVLCRCDSSLALEYGRQLGIAVFQGWHLDKMMNRATAM